MNDALRDFLYQHPLGRPTLDAQAVLTRFARAGAWEERYRELIQLGKQLPAIPAEWRGEEQELPGCESQVWLLAQPDAEGRIVACEHFEVWLGLPAAGRAVGVPGGTTPDYSANGGNTQASDSRRRSGRGDSRCSLAMPATSD